MKLKQIYISDDMAKRLKYLAVEQGMALWKLADKAIENFLESVKNGKRIN